MDIDEARRVVSALANGVHPVTGEVLPEEHLYNEPAVIRSLFTLLKAVRMPKRVPLSLEERQKENVKLGRPRNAGLPWTETLREELANQFRGGAGITDLTGRFERTRGAILSELLRQGLIEPDQRQAEMEPR